LNSPSPFPFAEGAIVYVTSSQKLPQPLQEDTVYYVVNKTTNSIQLSTTPGGTPINLTTVGSGTHIIGINPSSVITPKSYHVVNPWGYGVEFAHDKGILSAIDDRQLSTVEAIRGLFDQTSNEITKEELIVYRRVDSDLIKIISNKKTADGENKSIYGGILSIDGLEHVVLFDNTRQTVYTPFAGLFVSYVNLDGIVQRESNLTPNVGGKLYNLTSDVLVDNVESMATMLNQMYDSTTLYQNELIEYGRKLLGFQQDEILDQIGISVPDQYNFYRGLIHYKGTKSSLDALSNVLQFDEIKIDEVYGIFDQYFGIDGDIVYPRYRLTISKDALHVDLKSEQFNIESANWIKKSQYYQAFNENGFLDIDLKHDQTYTIDQNQIIVGQYVELDHPYDLITVKGNKVESKIYFTNVLPLIFDDAKRIEVYGNRNGYFWYQPDVTIDYNAKTITVNSYYDSDGSNTPVSASDTYKVVYYDCQFVEGTHFERINLNIIKLDNTLYSTSDISLQIEGYTYDRKYLPIRIYDTNENLLKVVTIHDPARVDLKMFYPIDYIEENDPAIYTNATISSRKGPSIWNQSKVNTIWVDASTYDYKRYFDFIQSEDNVKIWGSLADWSDVKIWIWKESDVHPSEDPTARRIVVKRERPAANQPFIDNWVEEKLYVETTSIVSLPSSVVSFSYPEGTEIEIYKNGVYHSTVTLDSSSSLLIPSDFTVSDYITFVKRPYVPTDEDLQFDPDIEDDLSRDVQYRYDYQYVEVNTQVRDKTVKKYYYWAFDTEIERNGYFLHNLKEIVTDGPKGFCHFGNVNNQTKTYDMLTIVGLGEYAKLEQPIDIEFTIDPSLDQQLAKKHVRYKFVRELQNSKIEKKYWDRITEALVGFKLSNPSIVVPAEKYVIDEQKYNDGSIYGLLDDQMISSKENIQEILYGVVVDENFDLSPYDPITFKQLIDDLFNKLNNTDVDGVIEILDTMYNNMTVESVNKLWFLIFHSGLSLSSHYDGVLKTSYVQLHVTKKFEVPVSG
jgi:hypothetical protein